MRGGLVWLVKPWSITRLEEKAGIPPAKIRLLYARQDALLKKGTRVAYKTLEKI